VAVQEAVVGAGPGREAAQLWVSLRAALIIKEKEIIL
jgi:hypothetical protein